LEVRMQWKNAFVVVVRMEWKNAFVACTRCLSHLASCLSRGVLFFTWRLV